MSRTRSFHPSDYRASTPAIRDNETVLSIRYNAAEGHYDTHCDLNNNTLWVTFSFLHNNTFGEPFEIYRRLFVTRTDAIDQFTYWRYNPYDAVKKLDADNTYCMPIILRDHQIKLLNHDPNKKILRQRKGKKFAVSMIFAQMACKDWHMSHYHGTKIIIEEAETHKVFHEEIFDCDHVWKGTERYKYILANFDMVYMEAFL